MSAKSNAQTMNDSNYDTNNSDFVKVINENLKGIKNVKW